MRFFGHTINKSAAIATTAIFLTLLLLLLPSDEQSRVSPNSASQNITQKAPPPPPMTAPNVIASENTVLVTRVIDGDTIELEGGQRVRYIGIDTPETVDPRKEVQCFGVEASNRNKQLVEGVRVRLEKDVSETDKYGRLLRYVYVGNTFVNLELVQQGFAHSSTYPPDVKYQSQFTEAESGAREAKRGLWGACPTTTTKPTTTTPSPAPTPTSVIIPVSTSGQTSSCVIKGNISSGGKIYHLPGCGSYDKTQINEAQGEHWFCTEEEAVAAGWRKAKNCP